MALAAAALVACSDDATSYPTYAVSIRLSQPLAGLTVGLTSAEGDAYQALTDSTATARFDVPAGIYEARVAAHRADEGEVWHYNGLRSGIVVGGSQPAAVADVELVASRSGQIVIRELYNGGCPMDDGSGAFIRDKYVTLYNNSEVEATISHLCLGMAAPYNAHADNGNYDPMGVLTYAGAGFIPAIQAIWYYPEPLTIGPGRQVVLALNNAVDCTLTYSASVNLARAEYYCTYDPDVFDNTAYYPAPSEVIPTSHYWRALFYGMGTAWPLSVYDPAVFIFRTEGMTPQEFAADATRMWYSAGNTGNPVYACLKVPTEWIVDAVEVYTTSASTNRKRLTPAVDAGAVYLTRGQGYALHRKVDVEATLAIAANEGRIVGGLPAAPDASTGVTPCDPSGIDAEASLRAGAIIIFQDTNNSSDDFYERYQATLRD